MNNTGCSKETHDEEQDKGLGYTIEKRVKLEPITELTSDFRFGENKRMSRSKQERRSQ